MLGFTAVDAVTLMTMVIVGVAPRQRDEVTQGKHQGQTTTLGTLRGKGG